MDETKRRVTPKNRAGSIKVEDAPLGAWFGLGSVNSCGIDCRGIVPGQYSQGSVLVAQRSEVCRRLRTGNSSRANADHAASARSHRRTTGAFRPGKKSGAGRPSGQRC